MIRIPILCLAAFLVTAPSDIHAQDAKMFGFKIGATVSNIRITDLSPTFFLGTGVVDVPELPKWQDVSSPSVEIFANLIHTPDFVLQAELTYLQRGAVVTYHFPITTSTYPDGSGEGMTSKTETSLRYLVLSLGAQPRFALEDLSIYADVRPTFSYLTAYSNLASIGHRLSTVQAGYLLGVGLDVSKVVGMSLFFEFGYAGDFRYFYDYGYAKLWNRSLSFAAGTTL